ncbi:MAG: T9SS type A sorting domain-containing protein [Bacteroidota bacterium]
MRRFCPALLFALFLHYTSSAQLVSYHLQQSFTVFSLDSFLSLSGFSLPIAPQYDIDVYQVIYKTPYKHIDSLVNASGIVVVPKNVACPVALGCYAHGSFAKRLEVPSYEGPERPIGLFFAGIGGVLAAMPDELGLGDSDSSILFHPYINAFHSGYASVNMMRAARQLADTLALQLSGEVLLTGYSQGGYTTMATNKLIQENFSAEFNIVASAPMSGPYDLKKTMVDVMLSTNRFSVPSYLPFLLLGYHSVYPSLQQVYPTPSSIFKSPYDSILPPLFSSKLYSLSYINQFCDSVPRNMIKDSVINDFANDTLHIFRQVLAENDLLGWAPQNPVKIHYCTNDEEVNYLNAVRADTAWRANGAPDIQTVNSGFYTHAQCVEPSITSAALYLLGKITACPNGIQEQEFIAFRLFPNPASSQLKIVKQEGEFDLSVLDMNGRVVYRKALLYDTETLDLSNFNAGFYTVQLSDKAGHTAHKKLVVK